MKTSDVFATLIAFFILLIAFIYHLIDMNKTRNYRKGKIFKNCTLTEDIPNKDKSLKERQNLLGQILKSYIENDFEKQINFYRKCGDDVGVYLKIHELSGKKVFFEIYFPAVYNCNDNSSKYSRRRIMNELNFITDVIPKFNDEIIEIFTPTWIFINNDQIIDRLHNIVSSWSKKGYKVHSYYWVDMDEIEYTDSSTNLMSNDLN